VAGSQGSGTTGIFPPPPRTRCFIVILSDFL
jgi:hypothetical protein